MRSWPNASKALKVWDEHQDKLQNLNDNTAILAWIEEEKRLGVEFGRAYWEDTRDINSLDTCEMCVRPTEKIRASIQGCGQTQCRRARSQEPVYGLQNPGRRDHQGTPRRDPGTEARPCGSHNRERMTDR